MVIIPAQASEKIDWKVIATSNFKVIYHPEVKEQAFYVAEVAEEVFPDLSKFTGFKPYRKIAIIVTGQDDIANGSAAPIDVVKIIVNPAYLSTRVDRDWLKNVVTHELTHILQMEATFGATYLLHKTTGASTPFGLPPNTLHPTWFLEGIAQYGSSLFGYDGIDRKRQMIFEQKIQNDKFYTNAEILWGRSNLNGEAYYNYGFGFFEYLMREYGEEQFIKLQKIHNLSYLLGLENSIKITYKKPLEALMNEWKKELRERYPIRKDRLSSPSITEKPELSKWNEPLVTPNGGVIFAESHSNRPSFQIKSWHPDHGLITLLDDPQLALTRLALSPKGDKIAFTSYEVKNQNIRFDLYELNLSNKKVTRLTKDQRIIQGVYFNDGFLVVKNDWGRNHLYYLENEQLTQLTDTDFNFNITDLAVSPDQNTVVINLNYNGKRGIGILSAETWELEKIYFPSEGLDLILGDFINNHEITFSWDRLDHYDLYSLNIKTDLSKRITNTREDILQGQVKSIDGQTLWIGQIYGSNGFTIANGQIDEHETLALEPKRITFDCLDTPKTDIKVENIGDYDHLSQLRSIIFLPFIDIENYDPNKNSTIGISQTLQDPLAELQINYQISWNLKEESLLPNLDLKAIWIGTNPGLGLKLQKNTSGFKTTFSQSFDYYPYFINTNENLSYQDYLQIDKLELQFGRIWMTNKPGSTIIKTSFYPATPLLDSGFSALFNHQQNIPFGLYGDKLTSQTLLGYSGGRMNFTWGKEGLMWVYPEKSTANRFVLQKFNYQHSLIDLSYDIKNFIQTGRLYGNIYSEIGLFQNKPDNIKRAGMFGAELTLESSIAYLIPMNLQIGVATNLQKNWGFYYNINFPF